MDTHFKQMLKKIMLAVLPLSLALTQNAFAAAGDVPEDEDALIQLGKYVFFDKISTVNGDVATGRMGCVSCHDPMTGGTGSSSDINQTQVVITGANPHTAGNLKPPTNAYASFIPPFHECNSGGLGGDNYCGGNFWSGRSEGRSFVGAENDESTSSGGVAGSLFPLGATKHIGCEVFKVDPTIPCDHDYTKYFGPTSDQALNPMPNLVEQNIQRQQVCELVRDAKYAELYEMAWGEEINCGGGDEDKVQYSAPDADPAQEKEYDISFKRLMLAVGAWQASPDLNSFSSKRDMALRAELACIEEDLNLPPGVLREDVAPYLNEEFCEQLVEDKTDPATWGKFPLLGLTQQENDGHDLFYNRLPIPFAPPAPIGPPFNVPTVSGDLPLTNCSFCHSDDPGPVGPGLRDDGTELLQLYSAQDYHSIGVPANPEIPDLDDPTLQPSPDLGIASHTGADAAGLHPPGFFKTPTTRNVDKRKGMEEDEGFIKAYTHNGWFKSLESLVHFYNTGFLGFNCVIVDGEEDCTDRGETAYEELTAGDPSLGFNVVRCTEAVVGHPGPYTEQEALANNCWPFPEFPTSPDGNRSGAMGSPLVGNLGMTAEQEAAIVAYLKTLTDTHTAKAPAPYKRAKK